MKYLLTFLILITLTSCGYRPSSKLSKGVMGEKISTSIIISAQDPENTVIIKDAVDQAVIEVFQASLCKKSDSDTHLALSIATPSYTPIVYDTDGFVIGYRMSVTLSIIRYHSGLSKNYTASGTYDFTVAANAVVTDQQRFEAIGFSAAKAIRSFVAQVSAEGARAKK